MSEPFETDIEIHDSGGLFRRIGNPLASRVAFERSSGDGDTDFAFDDPEDGLTVEMRPGGVGYVYAQLNIDQVSELRDWLNQHFAWLEDVKEPAHDD